MANQTPEHIKKKVIEMLFIWTREELKNETKIKEAYLMLKKQGIVTEDPVHVGGAVFASSLPPRQKEPLRCLSLEQCLLISQNIFPFNSKLILLFNITMKLIFF